MIFSASLRGQTAWLQGLGHCRMHTNCHLDWQSRLPHNLKVEAFTAGNCIGGTDWPFVRVHQHTELGTISRNFGER
ncbi:hypothetical protein EMIT0P258_160077 [Pseudomonas sp. IT-P258]